MEAQVLSAILWVVVLDGQRSPELKWPLTLGLEEILKVCWPGLGA